MKEGINMTELIWFTIGFVATLAIITMADTVVRCKAGK